MPPIPSYFHRLEQALPAFEQLPCDWVDRRTVEELLDISKPVAWRLLRQCGAQEGPGNTLICPKARFLAALRELAASPPCRQQVQRRQRLEEYLAGIARVGRSLQVTVAPAQRAPALISSRLSSLPEGVHLSPGRLTIAFTSTQDFLEKVGSVVFALQNDFDRVRAFLEQDQRPQGYPGQPLERAGPGPTES